MYSTVLEYKGLTAASVKNGPKVLRKNHEKADYYLILFLNYFWRNNHIWPGLYRVIKAVYTAAK